MTRATTKFVFYFLLLTCNVFTRNLRETNKIKPILLIVADGVGYSKTGLGDAVNTGRTEFLHSLCKNYPHTKLKAHGKAVGLPSDEDMGNSEVGHNALGCGQIYAQGAELVNQSIESGKMFQSPTWKAVVENVKKNKSTLHFFGLLSDGNVHSHINHLFKMLRQTKAEGVSRVRIHTLLDGRDVPATSALTYIDKLEELLKELNDNSYDAKIASGGGRMKITMDRYEASWSMVEAGWNTHVLGEGKQFATAKEAIETYRKEFNVIDQDLPAFVIAKDGKPVGPMNDNDSVVLFNFRGDRALEISRAFDDDGSFDKFKKKKNPKVYYAGLLEYDSEAHIPKKYLVQPPEIKNTLTELLIKNKLAQCAISETQKFGHVTYFWNGNRSGYLDKNLEKFTEITSDLVPFEERPWMKSAEITDETIKEMQTKKYKFIRINYPNGDMVGHTGNFEATVIAMEALDLALKRLVEAAKVNGYTVLLLADHGNAEEMLEKTKKGKIQVRTAHSLNPVPFIIIDDDNKYEIADGEFGLANVAATVAKMLGLEYPSMWEKPIIK
ncbi:MAG: 2,3-bisphosphoglycerate-independent phosphoglycerate mutase [archaeon]|nr:2,3-bisphosphoglycerate-independent phosphoglycerate mutase [archaeon]